MIDFAGVEVGLYEPGFGVLMARRSVQTLVDRFVRDGGTYLEGAVQRADSRRRNRSTRSSWHRASASQADRFVFALGPWLPKLFPDVIGPRIRADPAGGVLFRAAGRRPPLPAESDAGLGRLQRAATSSTASPTSRAAGSSSRTTRTAPMVDPDTQDRRPTRRRAGRDRRLPRPPLPGLARRSADRAPRSASMRTARTAIS